MKRLLATAAAAVLALGGMALTASPAQAGNSVLCYVPEYNLYVIPFSTLTRDGETILRCTGWPYQTVELVETCQPPAVAVNGQPEEIEGSDGNTYYYLTAECV